MLFTVSRVTKFESFSNVGEFCHQATNLELHICDAIHNSYTLETG
jgi:hypothetical protein